MTSNIHNRRNTHTEIKFVASIKKNKNIFTLTTGSMVVFSVVCPFVAMAIFPIAGVVVIAVSLLLLLTGAAAGSCLHSFHTFDDWNR